MTEEPNAAPALKPARKCRTCNTMQYRRETERSVVWDGCRCGKRDVYPLRRRPVVLVRRDPPPGSH